MNQLPLVSVVIPTHNRPDFLKKTLRSILQQTYKNLQIIVVSNGFNIENKKIVDVLQDKRLEYHEQENSGGPSSPRNHGVRKSKGKYIAFCDDDDLFVPEKIQKQVDVLENNHYFGLSYSKMLRFDNNKEWSVAHEEGVANFRTLLFINNIPVSSIFMRSSLIERYGGFLESNKVGNAEDYEFVLRYSLKTKFYFLNDFLIKYWSGKNRKTCLDSERNFKLSYIYTKTIIYIYYITYKNSNTSFSIYLKPALFHIKNFIKVILKITMNRLGLK